MSTKWHTLAVFALIAALPAWLGRPCPIEAGEHGASAAAARTSPAAGRHYDGLVLENRGDDRLLWSRSSSCRRGLGARATPAREIYDSGNSAVTRNYEEAIRWYRRHAKGASRFRAPSPACPLRNKSSTSAMKQ